MRGDQALRHKIEAFTAHCQLWIFAEGLFLVGKEVRARDLAFNHHGAASALPGNHVGRFTAGAALFRKDDATTIFGT